MSSKHHNSFVKDAATLFHLSLNEGLERLPKASIPLYQGRGKNYTPELIGTGFALHIGTHKKLITAGHVTDLLGNNQFYVPDNGDLRPFDCRISRFGHAGIDRSRNPIDISVIDLDEKQAARLTGYHFFLPEKIEHRHSLRSPDCHYAFVGYPANKNDGKFKATEVGTHLLRYCGKSITPDQHAKLNRPCETHLGIVFDKNSIGSDGKAFTAPDPYGISGCPVWSLGTVPEIVDMAKTKAPLLAGMGIEYRDHSLVAVRACLILQVIRSLHGELKTSIEDCPHVRLEHRWNAPQRQLALTGH